MSGRFERSVDSNLKALVRCMGEADAYLEACDATAAETFATRLALEEIVTNIIKYGFEDSENHPIVVSISSDPTGTTVRISDTGKPFDPLSAPEPQTSGAAEDRPIGGLGLHFVREIFDDAVYRREQGRNVLELSKRR